MILADGRMAASKYGNFMESGLGIALAATSRSIPEPIGAGGSMKVHRVIAATAASLAMTVGLSVAAAGAAGAAPVRASAHSATTASSAATTDRATVPVTGTFTNSA